MLFALNILKYSGKNRIKFSGHSEKFLFLGHFFYCTKNSENRQGILFYLTNKNIKQKVGTEGSAH
jgi:hypothetical protein